MGGHVNNKRYEQLREMGCDSFIEKNDVTAFHMTYSEIMK